MRTGSSFILRRVTERIEPKVMPVYDATTDPSYVPGLTAPRRGEPEDREVKGAVNAEDTAAEESEAAEKPEKSGAAEGVDEPEGAGDDAGDDATDGSGRREASAEDGDDGDEGDKASDEGGKASDEGDKGGEEGSGPALDASDRRTSIVANRDGVTLRLDDTEAEFGWDEIGAVEFGPSRFGRRLNVTVHTPASRWYPADVEAPSKVALKEWTDQLDAVLDAYFEE